MRIKTALITAAALALGLVFTNSSEGQTRFSRQNKAQSRAALEARLIRDLQRRNARNRAQRPTFGSSAFGAAAANQLRSQASKTRKTALPPAKVTVRPPVVVKNPFYVEPVQQVPVKNMAVKPPQEKSNSKVVENNGPIELKNPFVPAFDATESSQESSSELVESVVVETIVAPTPEVVEPRTIESEVIVEPKITEGSEEEPKEEKAEVMEEATVEEVVIEEATVEEAVVEEAMEEDEPGSLRDLEKFFESVKWENTRDDSNHFPSTVMADQPFRNEDFWAKYFEETAK